MTSKKYQTTDQSRICISLPKLLKRSLLCNSNASWINNLLLHRKDISISVIQNLCNQDFEIVTCRVLSLNYPINFICCYRPPSGNLQLFLEEFHGLLVKFSSEYILCCGDFNIHVNRICPASTDFKDILDEFGLVESVELPTHKNGNTLDFVIGPQKFEICLVSVSTSDHNWLKFDCLKYLLENRERSVVKFRNWKNVNLVDFNEDCLYHLWSIEGSPLIDSFLEILQKNKRQTCSRNGKSYLETRLPFLR